MTNYSVTPQALTLSLNNKYQVVISDEKTSLTIAQLEPADITKLQNKKGIGLLNYSLLPGVVVSKTVEETNCGYNWDLGSIYISSGHIGPVKACAPEYKITFSTPEGSIDMDIETKKH
ncbi:MAG: hypothetical protein ACXVCY_02340 [Pseudobdellovibrionaceae bacterium]